MLSPIKTVFATTDIILLVNHYSIILYEKQEKKLMARLTLGAKSNPLQLIKHIKKYNNPRVTLILDPQEETQKYLSIPHTGALKSRIALKKELKNISADLAYTILTHKPNRQDQNWKYLITKVNLNNIMHCLIKALVQHNIFIYRVHLQSIGNMSLCEKLQKNCKKEVSAPKNSYFFIYLQNSNDQICEFILKDSNIIDYKSYTVDENKLCSYIQTRFSRHKSKLRSQEVSDNRIYLILLLPEQYRSSTKTGTNRFFLSTRDIAYKFLKRTTSGACNYSSIINEIAFVRNNTKHISIGPVEKI